jgi:predicted DNA-binding transcriptional regulator AlpA
MLFEILGSAELKSLGTGYSDAKADSAPAITCPRLISREAAAAYICVSPNTFDAMVKNGQMPRARLFGKRRRAWDVRQLDIAIDEWPFDGNNTRVDETWSDVDAPEAAPSR